MNAPAAHVPEADVTKAHDADRRQAEYFRRVLHERDAELGNKIAAHQRQLIRYNNGAEASDASRMRRLLREEERERETVLRLIDALDARFPAVAPVGRTTGATPLLTVSAL
jgi:hypothetical protein